jgi:hypothetical protein
MLGAAARARINRADDVEDFFSGVISCGILERSLGDSIGGLLNSRTPVCLTFVSRKTRHLSLLVHPI